MLRLYHAVGQGFGILGPLMSGINTALAEGFDASMFIDLVNKHDATISDPTVGMWGELVAKHVAPVDNTLRIVDGGIPAHHLTRVQELFGFDIVEP